MHDKNVPEALYHDDVHEALNLNCEILDPSVRGSGSRVVPIWPNSKNVLNLRKTSSLLPYIFVKKINT